MIGTVRVESAKALKSIKIQDVKPLPTNYMRALLNHLLGKESIEQAIQFGNLHNYLKANKLRLVCTKCNKTGIFSSHFTISPVTRKHDDVLNIHLRVLFPNFHSECNFVDYENLIKSKKEKPERIKSEISNKPPRPLEPQQYFAGLPFNAEVSHKKVEICSEQGDETGEKSETCALSKLLTDGFTTSGFQTANSSFIKKQLSDKSTLNSTIHSLKKSYSKYKHKTDKTFSLADMVNIFPAYQNDIFNLSMNNVESKWMGRWGRIAAPYSYAIFPIETISKNEDEKSTTISSNGQSLKIPFVLRVPIANSIAKSGPFIIITKLIRDKNGTVEIVDAYAHPMVSLKFWMLIDSYLERESIKSIFNLITEAHDRGYKISVEHPLQNVKISDKKYGRPDLIVRTNGTDIVAYIEINGKANADYWAQKEPLHLLLVEKLIIDDRSKGDIFASNILLTKNLLININSNSSNATLSIFLSRCMRKFSKIIWPLQKSSLIILKFQYFSELIKTRFSRKITDNSLL